MLPSILFLALGAITAMAGTGHTLLPRSVPHPPSVRYYETPTEGCYGGSHLNRPGMINMTIMCHELPIEHQTENGYYVTAADVGSLGERYHIMSAITSVTHANRAQDIISQPYFVGFCSTCMDKMIIIWPNANDIYLSLSSIDHNYFAFANHGRQFHRIVNALYELFIQGVTVELYEFFGERSSLLFSNSTADYVLLPNPDITAINYHGEIPACTPHFLIGDYPDSHERYLISCIARYLLDFTGVNNYDQGALQREFDEAGNFFYPEISNSMLYYKSMLNPHIYSIIERGIMGTLPMIDLLNEQFNVPVEQFWRDPSLFF